MASKYTDKSSPTDGAGTILDPCNNWVTTKAVLAASDTAYLKGGVTINEEITVAAHDITITSYGTGQAIITGTTGTDGIDSSGFRIRVDNVEVSGAAQNGVRLFQSDSWVINSKIHGCTQHGIRMVPTVSKSGITFTNNEIYSNTLSGISIEVGTASVIISGITAKNNAIYSNGDAGILMHATVATAYFENVFIDGNTVYSNTTTGINVRQVTQTFPTYPTVFNRKIKIRNNVSHHNGSAGIYCSTATDNSEISYNSVYQNSANITLGGIWTGSCNGLVINGNHVYDNLSNGIDGMGIFDDQLNQNCIITNNLIHGHKSYLGIENYDVGSAAISCYRTTGTIISGNICYDNITGIVHFGSEGSLTENARIYNNTCVNNVRYGIRNGGAGNEIKNNVAYGNSGWYDFIVPAGSTMTENYNCFGTVSFLNGGALGANSISSDPKLSSNYELLATSPCIGTGTDTDVTDYNGERFTEGKYDMGALRARIGMIPAGVRKTVLVPSTTRG